MFFQNKKCHTDIEPLSTGLNILHFQLLYDMYKNDTDKIYSKLLDLEQKHGQSQLGFWVFDLTKGIQLFSPKLKKSLGYHRAGSFPKNWKELVEKRSIDSALNAFKKHLRSFGKTPFSQNARLKVKSGWSIPVSCSAKVVSWEGSNPRTIIGYIFPTK